MKTNLAFTQSPKWVAAEGAVAQLKFHSVALILQNSTTHRHTACIAGQTVFVTNLVAVAPSSSYKKDLAKYNICLVILGQL